MEENKERSDCIIKDKRFCAEILSRFSGDSDKVTA